MLLREPWAIGIRVFNFSTAIDYSWDGNNKHMLGVFGIDTYDNFAGVHKFDQLWAFFAMQTVKWWSMGYGEVGG